MIKAFSLTVAAVVLTGCVGFQYKSDEEIVIDRAIKRMEALQSLDFKKAYSYMSPGYREVKNLNRFKSDFSGAANMRSFSVSGASCEENRCVVTVARKYTVTLNVRGSRGAQPLENISRQLWLKVDGKWWYSRISAN